MRARNQLATMPPVYRVVFYWLLPGNGWGPGPGGWVDWQVQDFAIRAQALAFCASWRAQLYHGREICEQGELTGAFVVPLLHRIRR